MYYVLGDPSDPEEFAIYYTAENAQKAAVVALACFEEPLGKVQWGRLVPVEISGDNGLVPAGAQ